MSPLSCHPPLFVCLLAAGWCSYGNPKRHCIWHLVVVFGRRAGGMPNEQLQIWTQLGQVNSFSRRFLDWILF